MIYLGLYHFVHKYLNRDPLPPLDSGTCTRSAHVQDVCYVAAGRLGRANSLVSDKQNSK
jgi:hypothetical protein